MPLDPARNTLPKTLEHVHLMGICGTGMAALAGMLRERGYQVTGSDENVYPPMSDFLAGNGIPVMKGYAPENLHPEPDLVIVGNVIRAVNPEAVHLGELGLPYLSMPQALGHFFLKDCTPLVVAGTHGKTTTSSLLATALYRAGQDPSFMIGGLVEAFGRNYRLGRGGLFVVEGDEYDTAFFNKVSKFLHYRPHYAILTSIEFDHADIFADLESIRRSFTEFVSLIPGEGTLICCLDDPLVAAVAEGASCPVIGYGQGEAADWRVENIRISGLQTRFDVVHRGRLHGRYELPMPGRHNALNATAVIALLDHLGVERRAIRHGLATFEGVKRRQQVRGEVNGIMVLDDFAHHPTAVAETIAALREGWPQRRLIIVFEPRTQSSRRSVFQEQYSRAFFGADLVLVREIVPLETVSPDERFSSRRLAEDLQQHGIAARYFPDTTKILDYLQAVSAPGDIIAVLSNGGFDNIHTRLLDRLARA